MLFVHLLCACVMRGFWCRFSGWTLGMWIPLLLFCLENGIPSQVTVFLMLALLRWIFVRRLLLGHPVRISEEIGHISYILRLVGLVALRIRLTAWTNFGIFILGLLLKICWPWVPRTAVPKQQWNQPNQHTWRLGVLPKNHLTNLFVGKFFSVWCIKSILVGVCHTCVNAFELMAAAQESRGCANCLDCQTGGLF